jgi:hypothetical protein
MLQAMVLNAEEEVRIQNLVDTVLSVIRQM